MKKKVFGGIAALLILAGIAGSHNKPATAPITVAPASETTSQSTTDTAAAEAAPAASAAPTQTTNQTPVQAQAPAPVPAPSTSCNPNYSPCIPNSAADLDCSDIRMQVSVIGSDVYRLDADHDGTGCDSY